MFQKRSAVLVALLAAVSVLAWMGSTVLAKAAPNGLALRAVSHRAA